MKKMDRDGLLLCELQGNAFEESVNQLMCSSLIFIRRFMNSKSVKRLDNGSILETNIRAKDINVLVEEEYIPTDYGSVKYSKDEMFWTGYLYRYFSYTYELSSLKVYKIVKPKELRELFFAYHTLSPAQAIERILEAKGLQMNETQTMEKQYEIFKKIRENK
ncbi:antitoxin [Tannockella kyphosi]|uniref:antitoxin n=1 Tax=Tannockella kyphosi TaxID=2899121 RepID=UPI0020131C15|nr:antitoxin [Tannockella kyphosi]